MPSAAPRACKCGGVIRCGKCDRCDRTKSGHVRKTAERGYGWDWQVFRRSYLRRHPLCVDCESNGKVSAATEVHHKVKIKHDPSRRLDEGNLVALCGPCHDVRTARGE